MKEKEYEDILFECEDYHLLRMWCYCRIDENDKHIITTVVDYVKNKKHCRKVYENVLEEK